MKPDALERYFSRFETIIKKHRNTNPEMCMRTIATYAYLLFKYNQSYNNSLLEEIIDQYSNSFMTKNPELVMDDKTVVFYDSFGLDMRGLCLIYLTALVDLGYKVVYLVDESKRDKQPILNKHLHEKIKIEYISFRNTYIKQIEIIRECIIRNHAGKAFIYTHPNDISGVIAFQSIKKVADTFFIDLTDHAYWLGIHCCNTYIEFRDFGKKVCVDYRRIDESSLVKLPYYPYIDKSVAFEGLPFEIDNKKIILSGGDLYKTFDKNLTYYCLVEELIKKTDCVFLYVGKGDRRYLEELKSKYPTKIYIENERKDLFQLMKCSYIYLNTYPQMGGLMTQYAVMANKVPFTLCINGDLKGVLLNEKPGTIYYSDMHTMIADIIRSISDSEFLKNKYEAIKDSVISPERFALELERIMLSHRSTFVFLSEKTNINKFGESYKDRFSALDICDAVASRRNLHLFIYFPLQFMNGMLNKCGRLLKKVIRNE